LEAENIKSNASENGKLSLIPLDAGLPSRGWLLKHLDYTQNLRVRCSECNGLLTTVDQLTDGAGQEVCCFLRLLRQPHLPHHLRKPWVGTDGIE